MKKLLFAGLAAALCLVGCNKEADVQPLGGDHFEIVLSDALTRTVNNGMHTKWQENDELTVFYAPTGTAEYSANTQFVVQDPTSNRATGEVDLTADSYDWYLLYPYTKQMTTPTAADNKGWVTVGGNKQTQNGNDSMAHLSGKNLPVYGSAKRIGADRIPSVSMKHASAVIAFEITNGSDQPFTVESLKFTAPEKIVGTYFLDITGDAATYTPSGENYVYDNVTLTVKNGTQIAKGATAKFFVATIPFTAASGSKLTVELTVNGTTVNGILTKEVTLSKNTAFKAGYIKHLNMTLEGSIQEPDPKAIPYTEPFKDAGQGDFKVENVTLPSDLTYVWTYDSRYGMKASAYANSTAYASEAWLISPVIDLGEAARPVLSFDHAVNQFSTIETAMTEATVWVREKGGEWVKLTGINYPTSLSWTFVNSGAVDLSSYKGKLVQIGFKYTSTSEKAGTWEIQNFSVADASVPEFSVEKRAFEVTSSTTSVEISVLGNVDWTAEASEGATLDKDSGTGADVITVSFPANNQATPKEYTVFIRTDNAQLVEASLEEIEVDITQQAGGENVKGTLENPYTASEALAAVKDLSDDAKIENVYVEGVVTRVQEVNTQFGNATFFISDDGQAEGEFEIYRCFYLEGEHFTSSDQIQPGDEVVVFGTLVNYHGNTPEMTSGGKLISLERDENAKRFTAAISAESVAAAVTSVEVTVTGNVDWTASATNGASVDPASGTGDGTIAVTFPANTDTEDAKSYVITVQTTANVEPKTFEFTVTQAKAVNADGNQFIKVTSGLVSGQYLIVSEEGSVAMKDAADVGGGSNTISVTINNGVIVATEELKAALFTFDLTTGFIQGPNGKYIGQNSDANGMKVQDSGIANTVSISNGDADIVSGGAYLRYNANAGDSNLRFRYYKSSSYQNQKAIQLYKLSDGGSTPVTATLESITVTGQKTAFSVGDTFTHDTAVVTATYSDGSHKDVTSSAVFSTPDMTTAGTKEVTVSYTESGVTKTDKYIITVSEPVSGGNTVSMTMTEYVAAHNCDISSGNDNIHIYKTLQLNESVRMSTTGEPNCGAFYGATTQEWRLYQNKGGNVIVTVAEGCELKSVKLTFTNSNTGILVDAQNKTIKSGESNVAAGSSVTYTVANSKEGTTNGQIKITAVEVVYTGDGTFPAEPDPQPTEVETKITMQSNASVYVGETIALNATSNVEDATITYESEDPSIATVTASGVVTGVAEGTVKVYARIAGVEGKYTDAEYYCNVTVSTKPVETDGTVVFDQTFLAANKNGEKAPISYTNSSTYTGSVTELRVYKNQEFVVSAAEGYKITSIKMTCTSGYGPSGWDTGAPEGFTYSGSIGTWTGSSSSVSFKANKAQVRITELVVTYE